MSLKMPAKSRIPQVRSKLPTSGLPRSQIPSKSKLTRSRVDITANPLRDSDAPSANLNKTFDVHVKDKRSNRHEEVPLVRNNLSSARPQKLLKPKISNLKSLSQLSASRTSVKTYHTSSQFGDNLSISSEEATPVLNNTKFLVTSLSNKEETSETDLPSPTVDVEPDILAFERFQESVPRSRSMYSSSEKSFSGSQERLGPPSKLGGVKKNNAFGKGRLAQNVDGKKALQQHSKNRINLPPDETLSASANTLNYVKKLNLAAPSTKDFGASKSTAKPSKLGPKRTGHLGTGRLPGDSDHVKGNNQSNLKNGSDLNQKTQRSRANEPTLLRKKYQNLKPKMVGGSLKIEKHGNGGGGDHHGNKRGGNARTISKKKQATIQTPAAVGTNRIARPVVRPSNKNQSDQLPGAYGGETPDEQLRCRQTYLSTSSSHTDSFPMSDVENNKVEDGATDDVVGGSRKSNNITNSRLEMDTNHNPAAATSAARSSVEILDNHQNLSIGVCLPGSIPTKEEEEDNGRRKRENERYMDILHNPDMINFGHWRMRQEGNYSPEEKYGMSERRVIRTTSVGSHTSSSDVTSVDLKKTSACCTTDDDLVQVSDGGKSPSDVNAALSETSLYKKDKTLEAEDDLKDRTIDSMPSIGSTTLMAELVDNSVQDETVTTENTTINPKTNREVSAINDLLKGAAAAADESASVLPTTNDDNISDEHCKKLVATNLDDMQSDLQIFKQALKQMNACLQQEEKDKEQFLQDKEKVELRCRDLEIENERLKEKVKALEEAAEEKEVQQRQNEINRPQSTETGTSTLPIETSESAVQTEDFEQKKIDSMKYNLEMASQYIEKLKHARAHYDETMQQTEEAIHGMLFDLNNHSASPPPSS